MDECGVVSNTQMCMSDKVELLNIMNAMGQDYFSKVNLYEDSIRTLKKGNYGDSIVNRQEQRLKEAQDFLIFIAWAGAILAGSLNDDMQGTKVWMV